MHTQRHKPADRKPADFRQERFNIQNLTSGSNLDLLGYILERYPSLSTSTKSVEKSCLRIFPLTIHHSPSLHSTTLTENRVTQHRSIPSDNPVCGICPHDPGSPSQGMCGEGRQTSTKRTGPAPSTTVSTEIITDYNYLRGQIPVGFSEQSWFLQKRVEGRCLVDSLKIAFSASNVCADASVLVHLKKVDPSPQTTGPIIR